MKSIISMQTTKVIAISGRRRWLAEFWIGLAIFIAVSLLGLQAPSVRPTGDNPGFWESLHVNGVTYKWFGSLDEITAEASVVVVGRITGVTRGRVFTPEPQYADRASAHYLNATVIVDDILHGALADPSSSVITIELFAPNVDAIPLVIAEAPTSTSIFFLLNKAVHPATAYLPPSDRAAEAKYYEIIGEQAVLTEMDGEVTVPRGIDDGQFPTNLIGQPFEAVAATIRQIP